MPRIDDFPTLCAALGSAAVDRIRNFQINKMLVGGPRTRWVANPFQELLMDQDTLQGNQAIEDVFLGVARSSHDGKQPLIAHRLFTLLAYNKRVSTDLIEQTMNVESRQARRYMAAAKLAIYLLQRKFSASALIKRSPTLAEIRLAHQTL